jgi:predicted DNA-binding transcriptional regulator YafY
MSHADLQRHLRIGVRQVRRIVKQLRQGGVPVQQRWESGLKVFYLPSESQQVLVPELRFDAAELRALAIAAKASRSVLAGTPHAEPLDRAFTKLLEGARPVTYLFELEEPMQEWHFEDGTADVLSLENFRLLEKAMDESRSVRMNYVTAQDGRVSQGRKVDPYFFAKRFRAWVLVAYCHKRQKALTFAVTRISQVCLCDERDELAYFEMPADFVPEHFFRSSLGAITSEECFELRLLVEPGKAIHFRDRKYHPTQQIEEVHPDGRLVVSYELEGFEEMRSFCQGWGKGITVLEPDRLRQRLLEEAEELIRRYGKDAL